MQEKTLKALQWIVGILDKNKVDYQIAGGFAASVYGSKRKINDIDIDMHEADFLKIIPEIKPYIIYGPKRFKNEKWDLELITLDYNGQEIDLSGADTLRMSNKDKTAWISYEKTSFNTVPRTVNGLNIKVLHPLELINYKKELDGEQQSEDILAVEKYISENPL
ncbi:TPA: hypothetical protein DCQ44_02650 [Candidatus Taylorbacteria bacterium]|nr:hypothetical protein [Candidatus Taylorbacteria bacterium]